MKVSWICSPVFLLIMMVSLNIQGQSTSGIYSPACSNVAHFLEKRSWSTGSATRYEFINNATFPLGVWYFYNNGPHVVISQLNHNLGPGEKISFTQYKRPGAFRAVAIDGKYTWDIAEGRKNACRSAATKLADRLHKELCEEIGGSESCYR
jgi:hypothetical protein